MAGFVKRDSTINVENILSLARSIRGAVEKDEWFVKTLRKILKTRRADTHLPDIREFDPTIAGKPMSPKHPAHCIAYGNQFVKLHTRDAIRCSRCVV
jgi:hypothetical protein